MVPFGKRPKRLPQVLSGEEVFTTDRMRRQQEASHVPADSVFHRNAAERSCVSEDRRRGQSAHAASHCLGQGSEGTPRAVVATTADRTAGLLEAIPSSTVSVSRQDDRRSVVPFASTTIQKVCKAAAVKAGLLNDITPHTLRHSFANASAGSRSRSADDQPTAGSCQLQHDHEVSACASAASEQCAVAGRLASRATTARMGAAGEQPTDKCSSGSLSNAVRAPRVIDILREHVAEFVAKHPSAACPPRAEYSGEDCAVSHAATGSIMALVNHCNTGLRIPNSCGDRHCPQCRGAQRVTWVDTMRPLLFTWRRYVSGGVHDSRHAVVTDPGQSS